MWEGASPSDAVEKYLKSKTLKYAFSATLYQVFLKKNKKFPPFLLSFFPLLPPTDNFLRMALPALVLGVLLAVYCYFGNLGNALLLLELLLFHYKLYKIEPPPPAAKPMLSYLCEDAYCIPEKNHS